MKGFCIDASLILNWFGCVGEMLRIYSLLCLFDHAVITQTLPMKSYTFYEGSEEAAEGANMK